MCKQLHTPGVNSGALNQFIGTVRAWNPCSHDLTPNNQRVQNALRDGSHLSYLYSDPPESPRAPGTSALKPTEFTEIIPRREIPIPSFPFPIREGRMARWRDRLGRL